jgi:hypothetical protein
LIAIGCLAALLYFSRNKKSKQVDVKPGLNQELLQLCQTKVLIPHELPPADPEWLLLGKAGLPLTPAQQEEYSLFKKQRRIR